MGGRAAATVDEARRVVTFRATVQQPGQPLFGPGFGCTDAVTILPLAVTERGTGGVPIIGCLR